MTDSVRKKKRSLDREPDRVKTFITEALAGGRTRAGVARDLHEAHLSNEEIRERLVMSRQALFEALNVASDVRGRRLLGEGDRRGVRIRQSVHDALRKLAGNDSFAFNELLNEVLEERLRSFSTLPVAEPAPAGKPARRPRGRPPLGEPTVLVRFRVNDTLDRALAARAGSEPRAVEKLIKALLAEWFRDRHGR